MLLIVVGVVGGILALSLSWPTASRLLRFKILDPNELGMAAGACLALMLLLEAAKWVLRRYSDRATTA